MKQKVKELRVQIDGLAQLTKGLHEPVNYTWDEPLGDNTGRTNSFIQPHSEEIKDAVKSLFLAKAWLGKVLGSLGEESPYPKDGSRKTIADIEPTADQNKGFLHEPNEDEIPWLSKNHIEKVDWLRQEIQKIVKEWEREPISPMWADTYKNRSMGHLSEARFWLGFELERIKEQEN